MRSTPQCRRRAEGACMRPLGRCFAAALAYLWSGWGAVASLFLFLALWEWTAGLYGSLILPGPLESLSQLRDMLAASVAGPQLIISAKRAFYGLGLALAVG